jgi:hypothetical protein
MIQQNKVKGNFISFTLQFRFITYSNVLGDIHSSFNVLLKIHAFSNVLFLITKVSYPQYDVEAC